MAAGVVERLDAAFGAHDDDRLADIGIFDPVTHFGDLFDPAGILPDVRPQVLELGLVEALVEIALDGDPFRIGNREGNFAQTVSG